MRKALVVLLILAVSGLAIFFSLPPLLDRFLNSVENAPPYPASAAAPVFHLGGCVVK